MGASFAARALSKLPFGPERWRVWLKQIAYRLREITVATLVTSVSPIIRIDLSKSGEILFYASIEQAIDVAENREENFLSRIPEAGPADQITVEVPPGYDATDFSYPPSSFSEALAEGVRLRSERDGGDAAILFGRASDAIRAILGRLQILEVGISLSLRPLSRWERRLGRYPWIISVGYSGATEEVKQRILELRSWIGIGVEFAPPIRPIAFHDCANKPRCNISSRGTVSGILRDPQEPLKEYALTCDHVIPNTCVNLVFPSVATDTSTLPDAVLLSPIRTCFPAAAIRVPLPPVSTYDVEGIVLEGKLVQRLGGKSGRTKGLIKYPRVEFPFRSGTSRFPACCAVLYRLKFFWFIPIPFRISFSKPGDSGSWVVTKIGDEVSWVGMVQSGDGRDTIVLHASALVAYFSERLKVDALQSILSEEF
jgi:hypothetical protein